MAARSASPGPVGHSPVDAVDRADAHPQVGRSPPPRARSRRTHPRRGDHLSRPRGKRGNMSTHTRLTVGLPFRDPEDHVATPLPRACVDDYASLLSRSDKTHTVRRIIEKVAGTDATVLVRGESGVGKDLVARAIHAASPRHAGPFVKVNCAALPAELLESELFGYEKGAFTGAYARKPGKFEFANRGTICLDEIGEVPRLLQSKLLHVLQDLQ